jgi:hypothetical protein
VVDSPDKAKRILPLSSLIFDVHLFPFLLSPALPSAYYVNEIRWHSLRQRTIRLVLETNIDLILQTYCTAGYPCRPSKEYFVPSFNFIHPRLTGSTRPHSTSIRTIYSVYFSEIHTYTSYPRQNQTTSTTPSHRRHKRTTTQIRQFFFPSLSLLVLLTFLFSPPLCRYAHVWIRQAFHTGVSCEHTVPDTQLLLLSLCNSLKWAKDRRTEREKKEKKKDQGQNFSGCSRPHSWKLAFGCAFPAPGAGPASLFSANIPHHTHRVLPLPTCSTATACCVALSNNPFFQDHTYRAQYIRNLSPEGSEGAIWSQIHRNHSTWRLLNHLPLRLLPLAIVQYNRIIEDGLPSLSVLTLR